MEHDVARPEPSRKATVVGGQGYIGSALVAYLRNKGWDCQVTPRDQVWPVNHADLGHVFYCAGLTADYASRVADTVEAHVGLLTRVLASAGWDSLVYLSSTRLYDQLPPQTLAQESSSLPVSSLNTRHLFDLSKLLGEALCMAMGQGRARVARLACVYQDAPHAPGFLPGLLRQVQCTPTGGTLKVDSSPDCERDYVHLDDVLTALEAIALRGTQAIYNVASGVNTRNDELADWVAQRAHRNVEFLRAPLGRAAARICIDRLHHDCGWEPASTRQVLAGWLDQLATRV